MSTLTYTPIYTHTEINPLITKRALDLRMFEDFIRFLDCTPKTIETYRKNLKQFVLFLEAHNIEAPTREDIIFYREYLKENYKPATVQGYITSVKLFFQWTEVKGIYPNIASHVKGAKVEATHKKDYLTANQVKALLNSVNRESLQGTRDYALLCLMVTCGLRDIEVSRANINDIRTLGAGTVLYIQGKGRSEKTDFVKISSEVEAILREYISMRGETMDSESPLFISTSNNHNGERLTTRSISGIVKKHMIEAGFNSSRLTAHSLRHTAVTLSLLNGSSIQEAQQFARHRNLQTTLIYSHNLEKENNTCSTNITKAIF